MIFHFSTSSTVLSAFPLKKLARFSPGNERATVKDGFEVERGIELRNFTGRTAKNSAIAGRLFILLNLTRAETGLETTLR
jgi:hypothetical protein